MIVNITQVYFLEVTIMKDHLFNPVWKTIFILVLCSMSFIPKMIVIYLVITIILFVPVLLAEIFFNVDN